MSSFQWSRQCMCKLCSFCQGHLDKVAFPGSLWEKAQSCWYFWWSVIHLILFAMLIHCVQRWFTQRGSIQHHEPFEGGIMHQWSRFCSVQSLRDQLGIPCLLPSTEQTHVEFCMFILHIPAAVEAGVPFGYKRIASSCPLLCGWFAGFSREDSPQTWHVLHQCL